MQNSTTSKFTSFIKASTQTYHDYFYTYADPRIRDKIFMGDPALIVIIYLCYIIAVKVFLKRFMKNRQPYKLKIVENLLRSVLMLMALYFFMVCCKFWLFNYNWRCEPLDRSEAPLAMLAVTISHQYIISKFLYTLESVLIVLKKGNIITENYLMIHHTIYPFAIWCGHNYFPGGHAMFHVFFNSLTHAIMFGYQLVAKNFFLDRKLYKYIGPVAKTLLIIQLTIINAHSAQLIFKNDCNFSIGYTIACFGSLFISLYIGAFLALMHKIKSRQKIAKKYDNNPVAICVLMNGIFDDGLKNGDSQSKILDDR